VTYRLLFVVLALAAAQTGCRRKAQPEPTPRQEMEGFTLRQTQAGALAWELEARIAVLREDVGDALLSEPIMRFYRKGAVASRVSARSGRVRVDTHDVFLSSSVVLDAIEEHAVLDTDFLTYSSKRNLFTTDSLVQVSRPGGRLQGRGLEAKPDLSEIRIFNQQAVVEGDGK
jgi:LPS export ABC transporter protein LptC